MKNFSNIWAMVLVAMSLGTAWAIRGQFGHEQGAAWAGGIGSLALLLVAKRQDWYQKAFRITLAGAIGWGIGGMMSYGMVVGYGMASDFANVFYGFLMLFIIGGLYGFIGGGFIGLALSETESETINWPMLISEMVAGAIIFYFFLIEQFGWLMTPPRSELWAACLGISAAILWKMIREKHYSALRVASFSALGAGFGFGFGNFLQVLGTTATFEFNFWNVMEYSLGFFGGLGMIYGTLSSAWSFETKSIPVKSQIFPLAIVVVAIPFVVWQQSFQQKRISEMLLHIGQNISSDSIINFALVLILILGTFWVLNMQNSKNKSLNFNHIFYFFGSYFLTYICFSYLITGAFFSSYRIEQYLYFLNFIIIIFAVRNTNYMFENQGINIKIWVKNLLLIIVFFSFCAWIAINTHGKLKRGHQRFGSEVIIESKK